MTKKLVLCLIALLLPFSMSFGADDLEQRVKTLEDASTAQKKTIEELKKGAARPEQTPSGAEGRGPSGLTT